MDSANNPVQNVAIQFCDENLCNVGKTDGKGLAAFKVPDGKIYEIHVLKVPAGYKADKNIYKTLKIYSDIVITLEK